MTKAPIIPAMRYRDPAAAIAFLEKAFGFKRHAVFEQDGAMVHAQLTFGDSMVMLGPVTDTPFGRMMVQPDEAGGKVTQSVYVVVRDVDAHYDAAKTAGAKILLEPTDQDYGGRDYSAADPEGHIWDFGNYDPWNPPA